MEVAARLYGSPLPSPTHFFNGYSSVLNREEGLHPGVQAYEHGFDAAVLFSDISGFTKLTNRLIAERSGFLPMQSMPASLLCGVVSSLVMDVVL